ncbi:MAG: hemolysin family protein [Lachnospiraceae bacterium]|nr:hemolysin family protein [Lachnospiraceae bacterium]
MDTDGVIQSFIIFILICFSAFFSSAEIAFTTVNKVRLRTLNEEGNKAAGTALTIIENYRKMLSTVVVGNNVVNITASALTTSLVLRIWGNLAVGIATGILTFIILLWAEIIPKTLASLHAEKMVLKYAMLVLLLMKILTPVIFLVDKVAQVTLKIMRIDPDKKEIMTENELKTYVDVSLEDGAIETDERKMIYNVFDFSDTKARDIMIPRINMTAISADANYGEILAIFAENKYTRYPVYREDKDIIIGLINIKDFFLVAEHERENFRAAHILREGHYTYELKKTDDLMDEMREKPYTMAFILDEYGLTVGMITFEDLLEEIVGEIRDEYDEDEKQWIQKLDENIYLIEGDVKIDDINEAIELNLKSEDYDSIGGLMIEVLVRLPEDDETITTDDGVTLQAKGISNNRITKVLLTIPNKENKSGAEEVAEEMPVTKEKPGDDVVDDEQINIEI